MTKCQPHLSMLYNGLTSLTSNVAFSMTSKDFITEVGLYLQDMTENDFKFFKSKQWLKRSKNNGVDFIVISSATHYSPDIDLCFRLGKSWTSIAALEKRLGLSPLEFHFEKFLLSVNGMEGINYDGELSIEVNIKEDNPSDIATRMFKQVKHVALPFFEKFELPQTAREEMLKKDSGWSSIFPRLAPRPLFELDVVTNNIEHFKHWADNSRPEVREESYQLLTLLEHHLD